MSSSSSMLFLQSAMKSSLSTLLDQENGEPAVNLQAMRQLNQIVAQKTLGLGLKQCKKLILIDDAQNYWEKTNRFFRSWNHLASMKQQYDSWYQFQPYGQVGLSSRGRNFYLDAKKLNSCPSTKGRMDTSAWSPLLLFWIAGSGTAKISLEQFGRAILHRGYQGWSKKVGGMLRQRNAKSWLCVPIYSRGSKLGYQRDYWLNQVKYRNHPLWGLKLLTHSHTCLWTCMGDCDCVSVGVCAWPGQGSFGITKNVPFSFLVTSNAVRVLCILTTGGASPCHKVIEIQSLGRHHVSPQAHDSWTTLEQTI